MEEIRPLQGTDIECIWPNLMDIHDNVLCRIALGNGTAYTIGMMWVDENGDGDMSLLTSIIDKGAYMFSHYVHYSYAEEKLNLLNWDAMNMADFINRQLGLSGKCQGKYINSCVKA